MRRFVHAVTVPTLLVAAARTDTGLSPDICGAHAAVGTPEGDQVFAAATRMDGQGRDPTGTSDLHAVRDRDTSRETP